MSSPMIHIRALGKHVALIVVALLLVYVGRSFSCTQVDADFTAMRPEIDNSETLLIDRRAPRAGKLRRGDNICFTFASGSKELTWAGCVAAVQGQTFEVKGRALTVSGKRYGARRVPSIGKFDTPPILVPRGYVLVTFNKPPKLVKRIDQHLVRITAIKGRIIR